MKIKDFVEEFAKSEDGEEFIKSHITRDYLEYLKKISLCDRVINSSCYQEVNDRRVFHMNRPVQFVLFAMSIINEYTDIEQGENVIVDFDYLDQYGLLDVIVALIPKGEYETLQAILEMMIQDVMDNERSIASYMDNKLDAAGMTMEALGEALGELLGDAIEQ